MNPETIAGSPVIPSFNVFDLKDTVFRLLIGKIIKRGSKKSDPDQSHTVQRIMDKP